MAASSSTSPSLVIAAGQSVVTWDCRKESLTDLPDTSSTLKTFYPFAPKRSGGSHTNAAVAPSTSPAAPIADVAWNHNGQVLACCSTSTSLEEQLRKNIVLCSSHSGSMLDSFRHDINNQNNKLPKALKDSGSGPAATCVAFGGKSRYLCIGDQQGDVCLWDLKKQSRVRQFKSKSRIPCLQASLDPTATYVCSLSAEKLTLYTLRQATFAKQWVFSNQKDKGGGGWQQFRFSPLQPSLLALGDSTGRIQLFDSLDQERPQLICGGGYTNNSSMATSLLSHHARPITGLAFSTQNSKLLANIRANGILEFVDTSTGEVIHHQQTGGSATALAFQGVSCVVGNETGEVQVYDLRKMMQQFGKAVTTHQMPTRDPVKTLEFAPIPKSSSSSHNRSSSRSRTRSSSPPSRRPSGSSASFGLDAVSFDLESRASFTSYSTYQEPTLMQTASNSGPLVAPSVVAFHSMNKDSKPASVENQSVPSVLSTAGTSEALTTARDTPGEYNTSEAQETLQSFQDHGSRQSQNSTTTSQPARQATVGNQNNSTSRTSDRSIGSNATGKTSASQRKHTPSISGNVESDKNRHVGNANNSTDLSMGHASPEVNTFLQHMVRQELQRHSFRLREDLEGSLRNLHVDMIRQFQRQSQEMTSVLRQQQDQMERLMQENEFLREQNTALVEQQRNKVPTNGKNNGHKWSA